ncbi:MAG TPA: thioesterase family protein [Gemmataceae bacterium]|nr:thioesterase family protein [Gemmataceae bacterium]
MSAVFRTARRVEFGDTDMAGIVHFARFFAFMEAAECEFLRSLGLSVVMDWEGERVSFPRVSAACDYLRPARFEDVLTIAVSVRKVGEKSVSYGFEFFKNDEPDVIARGQLTAVCCRVGADRAIESRRIPDSIRARLGGDQ